MVDMSNSRVIAASVVGAVIGGVAGYLLWTEHGRTLRRQIEPALDDVLREIQSVRSTVQKVAGVASAGWSILNEAIRDSAQEAQRYPTAVRQSSPF